MSCCSLDLLGKTAKIRVDGRVKPHEVPCFLEVLHLALTLPACRRIVVCIDKAVTASSDLMLVLIVAAECAERAGIKLQIQGGDSVELFLHALMRHEALHRNHESVAGR